MNRRGRSNSVTPAIDCLEQVWQMLRAVEPDIPPAILIVMPMLVRRKAASFSPSSWRFSAEHITHEVAVHPSLFGDPRQVLSSLLHEAAHAILYARDGDELGGCTQGSDGYVYFHKATFMLECVRLGLSCTMRNRRYGFDCTAWPKNRTIPSRYEPILDLLKTGLRSVV